MLKCIADLDDKIVIHYWDEFLSHRRATKYFRILEDKLIYNSDDASMVTIHGKKIKIPRKQVAYGDDGIFYTFSGNKVDALSWNNDDIVCRVLQNIKRRVEIFSREQFNFVLINRYKNGDDCIGYHSDDEKELCQNSSIVGVSLGANRDILFKSNNNHYPINTDNPISINLKHGSIMMIKYPTNSYWKHSIPRRRNINNVRISLTFRKML